MIKTLVRTTAAKTNRWSSRKNSVKFSVSHFKTLKGLFAKRR